MYKWAQSMFYVICVCVCVYSQKRKGYNLRRAWEELEGDKEGGGADIHAEFIYEALKN